MEEAQYHFTSRALSRINRDRGILGAAGCARRRGQGRWTPTTRRASSVSARDSFVGTGPEVAARIEELKDQVGVDEMAVVTWTHDEEVRRESYTHLARAMGFAPKA